MRTLLIAILLCCASVAANAESGHGGPKMLNANVDLGNTESLQRGAKLFVNYCVSCHSANYMRYGRVATDLGIPEDVMKANMMFTTDKIGDPMQIAMKPDDAEAWFGVTPPDLSVVARSRGPDWLFSFLNGFYLDPAKPTGVNNLYFANTAMPHVLGELQGLNRAVFETETQHDAEVQVFKQFENERPGKLDDIQYRKATRDLVNFLVYVGEPAKLVRYALGVKVIAFLLVLWIVAYALKREYWKDVH
jgi:ubiquinol-cytochrome c reductase cytochrome c1 subunit